MMNINIRYATINDIEEISRLSKKQLVDWGIDPSCWSNDFLSKQVEKELVIVATIDGTVAGYSAWIDNTLSDRIEEGRAHITNTVINPNYRRRGIAETIRKKIIECCKERNILRITTNHHSTNKSIYNLSKKLGFIEYKEPQIDKSCEEDIFFELILDK